MLITGGELVIVLPGHSKIQMKKLMEVYWLMRDQTKNIEDDYGQQRSQKLTWQLASLLMSSRHQNTFSGCWGNNMLHILNSGIFPVLSSFSGTAWVAPLFETLEIG